MIAPHVQPGVATDELDRLCHDYIVNDLQVDSRAAELPRLGRGRAVPEVDLHLGQPRRVPRHPERAHAAQRRHRQRRRHRHQGRLPRRHEPHVHGRRRRRSWRERLTRVCFDAMWRGIRAIRPGSTARRHRLRDPELCRRAALFRRARVLRPRHRPCVPRGPASAALRPAGHGRGAPARHDDHGRADGQRRASAT